ncbi:hypothetical protein ACFC1B_07535 [Streptomyces xiamenensis]|uniref:hypothetical protein n=1 Tax=Streptomyces xiamenensis TaxID=408015 RepID=UPI0035E0CAF1
MADNQLSTAILRYQDGLPVYRTDHVPAHLANKTQLRSEGLSIAGLRPEGLHHYNAHHRICPLYSRAQARPVRPITEAQQAALAAGRLLAGTRPCMRCGSRTRWSQDDQDHFGGAVCGPCQPAAEQAVIDRKIERAEREHQAMEEMIAADRQAAAEWARGVLADPRSVILDLETTGLNQDRADYAVEISVLTATGDALMDQRLNPGVPIPADASAVHGILGNELCRHRQAGGTGPALPGNAECAMEQYSAWYGQWSAYHGDYRWQALDGPHNSTGDCNVVIDRIREMAASCSTETDGNPR